LEVYDHTHAAGGQQLPIGRTQFAADIKLFCNTTAIEAIGAAVIERRAATPSRFW
jgi:hypothetical protein